jgi:hypothetical protein
MYLPACLINHTGGRSTCSPRAALKRIGSLPSAEAAALKTVAARPLPPLVALLLFVFVASNRVPAMVDDALCASTEVNADMVVSFVYLSHEKTKSISD